MFEVDNITVKEEPVSYVFFINKHFIAYVCMLNGCLLLPAVVHCYSYSTAIICQ